MTIESNYFQLAACSVWVVDIAVQNGFHKAAFYITNQRLTLYDINYNLYIKH